MRRLRFLLPLLVMVCAPTIFADALPQSEVPGPLKPWISWALRGHEETLCPADGSAQGSSGDTRGCVWPARLKLVLDAKGGKFSQAVQLYRDLAVPLPGNSATWPRDVRADGKPVPVVDDGGHPAVWLKAGAHTLEGNYAWEKLPESLVVPAVTGLVSLELRGAKVAFPSRGADGLLWLQREQEDEQGESKLDVQVWRLVVDDNPLRVTTRIQLEVSGKNREVLLGRALLEGFVPVSLDSELPARLEADGRLRVQVRPGKFKLELIARDRELVTSLALPVQPAATPAAPLFWPNEELWAFEAQPDLRAVEIVGVPSIDASQTTLPNEWRSVPAYRMAPGDTMRLNVERRGDAMAPPDELTLARNLWLDFDGSAVTAHDWISGKLTRSDRLEMSAPSELGRVRTQGRDQLITQLTASASPGVELREGIVSLEAESRQPVHAGRLSAVSWHHGMHALSATLNLPPGWRLIHASGADEVSPTWLQSWSLLDLFLLLIATLAAGRLFGWPIGVAMFVGLGLALPEGAPKWLWLFPLAAEALLRVVPPNRLHRMLWIVRAASLVALALVLAPFAVRHLRVNLHPSLAHEMEYRDDAHSFLIGAAADRKEVAADETTVQFAPAPRPPGAGVAGAVNGGLALNARGKGVSMMARTGSILDEGDQAAAAEAKEPSGYQQQLDLAKIDPDAIAQTGPGLPNWTWSAVALRWSGPVDETAQVRLWLLSPAMNLLLAFLRVILLALLWFKLLAPALGEGGLRGLLSRFPKKSAAIAAAIFFALGGSPARADEMPPESLLNELTVRLTAEPSCGANCLSSPRMIVEAQHATLRLRIQFDAVARVAAPLPGSLSRWAPETVLLDGKPAAALQRSGDGTLYLALEPGTHQVILEGPIPARDELELSLPLKPKHVDAQLVGWTLDGLHDDGIPDETLQLVRVERGAAKSERLEPGQLPPSVEVERALLLGMTWQVSTHVRRRSPSGTPFTVEVPLLTGESITSADVRAQNGKALVAFGPHTDEVSWTSTLAEASKLTLTAADDPAIAEVWRLEVAPAWHLETKGIPPVHQEPQAQRVPAYRPWPRETLELDITRPAPVAGASITIVSSALDVTPGARASDAQLSLELRTSRGGPISFTLPEGAELQSIELDHATQSLRQDGRRVTLSLTPGDHQAKLAWREPTPLSPLYKTPRTDLGLPSVNAAIQVHLPDRWVLLLGGPRMGPAVLIWSFVIVMLLCAFGLSRAGNTPLRMHQWMLLALGLTQVDAILAAVVAGWFLVLAWRRDARIESPRRFDLLQLFLVLWTALAAGVLIYSIERGLLGAPEMQVAGNASSAGFLNWFADRSGALLPGAWIFSLPIFVYRLAMLAWALWLALAMVRWLPWAWGSFAAGGIWRAWPKRPRKVEAPVAAVAAAPETASDAAPR